MIGVQRSAKTSLAIATGQNWPNPDSCHDISPRSAPSQVHFLNWKARSDRCIVTRVDRQEEAT